MDTAFRGLRSIVFIALMFVIAPVFGNQGTLLIMGDSLSAAYGVQTDEAWVSLLRERWSMPASVAKRLTAGSVA